MASRYPPCKPKCAPRLVATWAINTLVSNIINGHGSNFDNSLSDPWGIQIWNNQIWVVNNGSDTLSSYDMYGHPMMRDVRLRSYIANSSHPSGLAINTDAGFMVRSSQGSRPAIFLTATEHGQVKAFNPEDNSRTVRTEINNLISGYLSSYKGIAVAHGYMYLADFFGSRIQVYNADYQLMTNFPFVDGDVSDPIPSDYGPYNIVAIGPYIYVLYTRKDPEVPYHEIGGRGVGFISVFTPQGGYVGRFTSRGELNEPWGMIPAPCDCGLPAGSFLVGNRGDGRVLVFDGNGRYVGPLCGQDGTALKITGLRGLAYRYCETNQIFFTASIPAINESRIGCLTKFQVMAV